MWTSSVPSGPDLAFVATAVHQAGLGMLAKQKGRVSLLGLQMCQHGGERRPHGHRKPGTIRVAEPERTAGGRDGHRIPHTPLMCPCGTGSVLVPLPRQCSRIPARQTDGRIGPKHRPVARVETHAHVLSGGTVERAVVDPEQEFLRMEAVARR